MNRQSPTPLFCLHFLGGSARSWDAVAAVMSPAVRCIALDLPGFGAANTEPGATVAGMADRISDRIRSEAQPHWWIAGHSMGAKVALLLARRAEAGEERLKGLAGIALLAGSPPAPEPMEDAKRDDMLRWIDGSEAERHVKARAYIKNNVGESLDQAAADYAIADVLGANPAAWKLWLTTGSREDCRETIGALATPALVVSGSKDAALGPDAQERLMLPHLRRHRHVALAGAGHLLPIERPHQVSALLRDSITLRDFA